jgi:Amt family ammonium transporter
MTRETEAHDSCSILDICTSWVWGPNGKQPKIGLLWILDRSLISSPLHLGSAFLGWLNKMGVLDYAGGGPVHLSSGIAAVAYALMLGKRKDFQIGNYQPHNISFVFIGTGLLWFGWLGFNGGSALGSNPRAVNAIITSHVAACVGGTVWGALEYFFTRKFSMVAFCAGAVAGLATITPGCGFVNPSSALVFGLMGATICFSVLKFKRHFFFDDSLDVFGVHYVGGLVRLTLVCPRCVLLDDIQ